LLICIIISYLLVFLFRFYNTVPAYVEPSIYSDIYTLVSSLYLYVRGGVRLKYLDNTSVTGAEPFSVFIGTGIVTGLATAFSFQAIDASNDAATTNRNGLPSVYYKAGFSGEVQVPAYGRCHSRLVTDCLFNATNGYNNSSTSSAPDIYVSRSTYPPVNTVTGLLRSASDDANCGVFLAVPPVSGNVL